MDIGSSSVSVYIGERGINNTINVLGRGECAYAGFSNGVFLRPNELTKTFLSALKAAENNSRTKVRLLNIGLPGEFCTTVVQDVELSLGKRRKVSSADLLDINELGTSQLPNGDFKIINIQPLTYILDNSVRTLNPDGQLASKIASRLSFSICSNALVNQLTEICTAMGVEELDLCSALVAQSLFLFEESRRDNGVILIDCGYLSTSVAIIKGDGLAAHYSFSVGGAHIAADLNIHLGIPYIIAESLKKIVKLSINVGQEQDYEVVQGNDMLRYNSFVVNALVTERIKAIGKSVTNALQKCDFASKYSVYLTGGGISFMRGAKDILAKVIERKIDIIAPTCYDFNKPHLSSSISLLDMVLNSNDNFTQKVNKKSLFGWLLGR
jgi:cell division protein FtsA